MAVFVGKTKISLTSFSLVLKIKKNGRNSLQQQRWIIFPWLYSSSRDSTSESRICKKSYPTLAFCGIVSPRKSTENEEKKKWQLLESQRKVFARILAEFFGISKMSVFRWWVLGMIPGNYGYAVLFVFSLAITYTMLQQDLTHQLHTHTPHLHPTNFTPTSLPTTPLHCCPKDMMIICQHFSGILHGRPTTWLLLSLVSLNLPYYNDVSTSKVGAPTHLLIMLSWLSPLCMRGVGFYPSSSRGLVWHSDLLRRSRRGLSPKAHCQKSISFYNWDVHWLCARLWSSSTTAARHMAPT